MCIRDRLDFQQEDGLMSALPLALNRIEIQRGLTTSSLAIFVPFTTQEPVSYTHLDVYKRQVHGFYRQAVSEPCRHHPALGR